MPHVRIPPSSRLLGFRVAPALAAAGVLLCLAGCRATPGYQGGTTVGGANGRSGGQDQRRILATYRYRRLTSDLPGPIWVTAVIAAATQALAGRGYAVERRLTHGSGQVVASAPGSGMLDKVTVSAREVSGSGGAVRVEIVIDPLGDQTESRAILDAMLARLGL